MEVRSLVLGLALVFIVVLGVLTVQVLLRDGLDLLVVFSLIVLALFGFGIVGALLHPPDQ